MSGFTLVELLVALLVFGMLTAAGVALLSFSVRAQDMADARLEALAEVRRAGALLGADLGQAAPRLSRDAAGATVAAFGGGTGREGEPALLLVRRGWDNPEGLPRPSLQKVEYRLAGGRLERRAFRQLDGAEPLAPVTLVEGVRAMRLRYRDEEGQWRERWDPTRITALPVAVELVLETANAGEVRQLFVVGTGA